MPNGYREVEELEMTRVEKVFVFGLIIFLLIGGFWTLNKIDEMVPRPVLSQTETYNYQPGLVQGVPIEEELGVPSLRTEVDRLQKVVNERQSILSTRQRAFDDADREYQFRREESRTANETGQPTPALKAAHGESRRVREIRLSELKKAQSAYEAAAAALKAPQKRLDDLQKRASKIFDARELNRNILLLVLHFLYAGLVFLLSWKAWERGRQERWKFLSLLTALLTASVIQLIFLVFRYCWELFLQDFALLGTSVIGIIGCSLAIVALKRYVFSPERVARNRLAGHACPNCTTPFESGQHFCWDCGRPLQDTCPHCGQPHLRFAPHCSNCGQEVPPPAATV